MKTFTRVEVLMDVQTEDQDKAWKAVHDALSNAGLKPEEHLDGDVFHVMLFDVETITP